ncbi:hypothetical protein C5S39_13890 [Candidatus Methanophagaceae archaeon]|nr:hypothetical protein C5S39_13890 [Methanophagales archaeon]
MNDMDLKPVTNINELNVVSNRSELRRDVHTFVNYTREREVKRTHRSNDLSKTDIKRLAKLMGDPETQKQVKITGTSPWIDFIDHLALLLGFVRYETEGEYMGYTSTEPSYPDNYIMFQEQTYDQFLLSSLIEQEEYILNALIKRYDNSDNEFFSNTCPFSVLDGFERFGCATGVVPTIRFDKARRHLLELLKECNSGVWYSTASFCRYLKKEHPYFLIPQNIKVRERWWAKGRYGNFRVSKKRWGPSEEIPENAPDAFERVEGRYVERFLENIPLTMRYVDLAYDKEEDQKIYPSINKIKAFRVTERFLRVMKREIRKPRVTVLPTFEIHVDSELYPISVMTQLTRFADVLADDVAIVLKLKKNKVAAQLAEHEGLNVTALLEEVADNALPPNIVTDLEEWTAHAETFTLFEGFGLLECAESLKLPAEFIVTDISPELKIVRSQDNLYSRLESSELVPILVKHPGSSFRKLPKDARSVFLKKAQVTKRKKKAVNIKRNYSVTLYLPSKALLKRFSKELKNAKFPFSVNELTNAITFSKSQEPQLKVHLKALEKEYEISIEDMDLKTSL